MDIISITIGIVFLALFTVPFLIVRMSNRKKERELIAYFKQLALENNVAISEFDCWNKQYIIGIDAEKRTMCYLQSSENKEKFEVIVCSEIKLVEGIRTDKSNTNVVVIDKLELVIELKNGRTLPLEFFNASISNGLSGEIVLVEKWKKLLN